MNNQNNKKFNKNYNRNKNDNYKNNQYDKINNYYEDDIDNDYNYNNNFKYNEQKFKNTNNNFNNNYQNNYNNNNYDYNESQYNYNNRNNDTFINQNDQYNNHRNYNDGFNDKNQNKSNYNNNQNDRFSNQNKLKNEFKTNKYNNQQNKNYNNQFSNKNTYNNQQNNNINYNDGYNNQKYYNEKFKNNNKNYNDGYNNQKYFNDEFKRNNKNYNDGYNNNQKNHNDEFKINQQNNNKNYNDNPNNQKNYYKNNNKYYSKQQNNKFNNKDGFNSSNKHNNKFNNKDRFNSSNKLNNPISQNNITNKGKLPKKILDHFDYCKEQLKPHIKNCKITEKLNVLMVAEKPSIAKSIADSLSNNYKTNKFMSKMCHLHQYFGSFFGANCNFTVTSVAGHLFEINFDSKFKNWDVDPTLLYDANICTYETKIEEGFKLQKQLKSISKNVDIVVLWLDNDREGENICFEVLDLVFKNMNQKNFRQIYRAKFSSLDKFDLKRAFLGLENIPNINESNSVEARKEIDLKLGISFSRYQSQYFKDNFSDFKNKIISFGPCQTPTLAFCVKRYKEIQEFKPKKYYKIKCTLGKYNINGEFNIKSDLGKIFNKPEADKYLKILKKYEEITLSNIKIKDKVFPKPNGINTVTLLKHCSSFLGLSPHSALSVAEKLYLAGYLTYPRTESTHYPKNFHYKEIIGNLMNYNDDKIKEYASFLNTNSFKKPNTGKDCGDHPPITPTTKIPNGLNSTEKGIYNYVVKTFLANISDHCEYVETELIFNIENLKFNAKGIQLKNEGFTKILKNKFFDRKNNFNFELKKNSKFNVKSFFIEDKLTKCPTLITENELLDLMDKYHIGTDASMATHINKICEREYVKVNSNKRTLEPTNLGLTLINSYEIIDKELIDPNLRGNMEKSLDKIAYSEDDYMNILSSNLELFRNKFLNFKENIDKMKNEISKKFVTNEQLIEQDGKLFTKCGKCKKFMDLYSKLNKLKCKNCNLIFELPPTTKYRVSDNYCDKDKFQLIWYNIKTEDNNQLSVPYCVECKGYNQFTNKCFSCNSKMALLSSNNTSYYLYCLDNCKLLKKIEDNISKARVCTDLCSNCKFNKISYTFSGENKKVCLNCSSSLTLKTDYLGKEKPQRQNKHKNFKKNKNHKKKNFKKGF